MSHKQSTGTTVGGRDLDDFFVDSNFKGAFVGGPPLMTHEQAREIIENPAEIQKRALEALRRLADKAEGEAIPTREQASFIAER